jgi:hypothetical protein
MGLSIGISFVIGVIVAQGDPRNPFREITALEQFIERIFTNSLRPI